MSVCMLDTACTRLSVVLVLNYKHNGMTSLNPRTDLIRNGQN